MHKYWLFLNPALRSLRLRSYTITKKLKQDRNLKLPQPEGYIEPNVTSSGVEMSYVHNFADHLGNIRLSYKDKNQHDENLSVDLGVVEQSNYYLFGLKHKGYNNLVNGTHYPYGYNGKEENDELGLEWLDFGARNYDASLGRWMNIDPLAELMRRHSPYNYAFDNPVYFIDPDGRAPEGVSTGATMFLNKLKLPGVGAGATALTELVKSSIDAKVNEGVAVVGFSDDKNVLDVLIEAGENTFTSLVAGNVANKLLDNATEQVAKQVKNAVEDKTNAYKGLQKSNNITQHGNTRVKDYNKVSSLDRFKDVVKSDQNLQAANTASTVVNSQAAKTVTEKATGTTTNSIWSTTKAALKSIWSVMWGE